MVSICSSPPSQATGAEGEMVLPAGGSVPGWSWGSAGRSSPLQLALWTTHCCSCLAGIPGRSVASAGVLGSKVPRKYPWDRHRERAPCYQGLLKLNYFAAFLTTQKTCAAVAGNRLGREQDPRCSPSPWACCGRL